MGNGEATLKGWVESLLLVFNKGKIRLSFFYPQVAFGRGHH